MILAILKRCQNQINIGRFGSISAILKRFAETRLRYWRLFNIGNIEKVPKPNQYWRLFNIEDIEKVPIGCQVFNIANIEKAPKANQYGHPCNVENIEKVSRLRRLAMLSFAAFAESARLSAATAPFPATSYGSLSVFKWS